MWFVLGLVTLLGGLALGWKLRRDARWKGEATARGEFAFLYARPKKGKRRNEWRYGIPVRGLPEFRLKRQSLNDALFRKVGISNEVQTGDALFDRTVYVVSDLPVVRLALQRDPELRRRLLAVFQHMQQQGYKLKELRLAGDRLWLRAFSRADHDSGVLSALPDLLGAVAERLPEVAQSQRFDSYVLRAAMVLTLSTALAISGAVLLFGLIPGRYPALLDSAGLWRGSFTFAAPLLAVLVLVSLVWLGRSSRTHLILLELLIVGSFGVWSWTFYGLREANFRLDSSPPAIVELRLASKAHWTTTSRRRKGGRSTTHHYELRFDRPLVLPGRASSTSGAHALRVDSSEYAAAVEGRNWHFTLRRGRLGWPWVEAGAPAAERALPAEGD